MASNIEETNVNPPVRQYSCWEIPGYFAGDLDSFKKVTDLGSGVITLLGYFLSSAADYLKPIGATFKVVSGYIPATLFISNIASWIPDKEGKVKALKTEGSTLAKGINSAATNALDGLDTVLLAGKLNVIDMEKLNDKLGENGVTRLLSKDNFMWLKSGLGFIAAGAATMDILTAIKNANAEMEKDGVTFDLLSGLSCQGWFKVKQDTPAAQMAVEKAQKSYKGIFTNALKTLIKTAAVALSIFGWALHPLVGFLSLAYTIVGIAGVMMKNQQGVVPHDPQHADLWRMARKLPVV